MNWKDKKDLIIKLSNMGQPSHKITDHLKDLGYKVGSRTIRRFIKEYKDEALSTFEEKLEENNFTPPENWSHGWLKTKEASIFIKNGANLVSFDQMREEFIQEMKLYSPGKIKIKVKPVNDPHLLVIDIADLHIGKLASATETGETYNTDIAVKRAREGVAGILQKASGFGIDQILFVIGNDVLHVDNANKATTSGTPQDVSGMWYDNYKIARKVYIEIIYSLLHVAPVHIVHNPSNHDYVTGYMLADSVQCWFKDQKNVTFDVTMAHRKYYKYGRSLIGTTHGDGCKLNEVPLIMANEAKQEWAETDFRYVYLHHIHHKDLFKFRSGKDYHGCTVEYLRSPSGTDSWHHRNGYQHAPKAIEGFLHHKQYGQVARLTHLFK